MTFRVIILRMVEKGNVTFTGIEEETDSGLNIAVDVYLDHKVEELEKERKEANSELGILQAKKRGGIVGILQRLNEIMEDSPLGSMPTPRRLRRSIAYHAEKMDIIDYAKEEFLKGNSLPVQIILEGDLIAYSNEVVFRNRFASYAQQEVDIDPCINKANKALALLRRINPEAASLRRQQFGNYTNYNKPSLIKRSSSN